LALTHATLRNNNMWLVRPKTCLQDEKV